MTFVRMIQHLLPNARAWRVTVDKQLRQFLEGLAATGDNAKVFFDEIWLDIFPETTRELGAWEGQFALADTGVSEQERRDRLAATWKALGGQDPRYIEDTLRGAGFDVYLHEWWVPGSEGAVNEKKCATPRDPTAYLRRDYVQSVSFVECGEALAQCGETTAQAGNGLEPRGYPLVNKILQTTPDLLVVAGEELAACGESRALCGDFDQFTTQLRSYIVPTDPDKWPYFLYIGGQAFGDLAQVDSKRRDEFEALCLKTYPTQQWLGILVEYT